jgi:hypothetical protein
MALIEFWMSDEDDRMDQVSQVIPFFRHERDLGSLTASL